MEILFTGKTAFLTGGSRGIGAKIKEFFEDSGAVVLSPPREELDLASPAAVDRYIKNNPGLQADIFIHCAGRNILAGIDEINDEILQDVFQVNFYAPTRLIRHFSQGMKKRNWGRILFISSLYAVVSRERRIAYSSSKNALTGLAKTLALELARHQILVNLIAPGYVLTDMTRQNLSQEERNEIQEAIPVGRFQSEQDVASLAAFLCSDFNQSITGQLVAVDGGLLCK